MPLPDSSRRGGPIEGLTNYEALIAAGLFSIVLLPVAMEVRRGRSPAIGAAALAFWLAASTAGVWAAIRFERPPNGERTVTDRPIEVLPEEYVSSDTCRSCHPDMHASWQASYHRSMTQVATPETVVGDFDGVELTLGRFRYLLQRHDDEFWVDQPDTDGVFRGPGGPRVQRQIVLTTGSHHMQAYWYASGHTRVLGLLPFVYLIEERRWVPRKAAFLTPPRDEPISELGRWNGICMECHATLGRMRPISPKGHDTHVAEFGIACEACHGPGREHVRVNRNPQRRYRYHFDDTRDPSIVQPGRLTHRPSSQVCGQCHSSFIWSDQQALDRWMRQGFLYRPGDDLLETRSVVRGKLEWNPPRVQDVLQEHQPSFLRDTFWTDGMNRVSGREYNGLLETPCHQRGELSCLSCHQLHREADDPRATREWANDQLRPGMRQNEACLQCHDEYETTERLRAHTYHEADSSGSNCYNCHMSHTTYGLLKAIRSHQIDSPTVQTSLDTGRPNACNQCHLDRTLAWTADYLERWYQTPQPALSEDERTIAASVLWILRGDAGQRALMAWSLGWEPALQASGADWPALFLATTLNDPYDAVRLIAYRSLQRQPGFSDFDYDYVGPAAERIAARRRAYAIWGRNYRAAGRATGDAILIDPAGQAKQDELIRLVKQRDDRPVHFAE